MLETELHIHNPKQIIIIKPHKIDLTMANLLVVPHVAEPKIV